MPEIMRSRLPRFLAAIAVLIGCLQALGMKPSVVEGGTEDAEEPTYRLLLYLVVDQLPTYLLERYDSLYTGGFRRLLDEGRVYTQATHDHAATETSPGHATLATGVYPARHGIPANAWRERAGGELRVVKNVLAPSGPVLGLSLIHL